MEETTWNAEEWRVMTMDELEAKEQLIGAARKALKGCIIAMLVASALLIASFVVADMSPQRAYAADLSAGQATLAVQASGKPYADVSTKVVDKGSVTAIAYVKAHKGFNGVIKGKRFYPLKTFTRAQFIKILTNFYGSSKVPVTASDVQHAKSAVTAKYATAKFVAVAKRIGIPIKWSGGKQKLSRASVAKYLKNFAAFDSAFRPKH